jgi:hypothetical protein
MARRDDENTWESSSSDRGKRGLGTVRAHERVGTECELRFHLDTDTPSTGWTSNRRRIGDGLPPLSADLSITKTDGVATLVPGGRSLSITASNAGTDGVTDATVADTFPLCSRVRGPVGTGGGVLLPGRGVSMIR